MKTMLRIETDFGFMSDTEKGFSFDGGEAWHSEASEEDVEDCMDFIVEIYKDMRPNKEDLEKLKERLEQLLDIY